jgi:MFS transporter, AAHS family, benzoate transport protein
VEQLKSVSLNSIMEKLPMTRQRYMVLIMVVFVMIFEGYDTMIMPYVMPKLEKLWHLSPLQLGSLASYGAIGLLIGSLFLGPVADRFGRRPIIIFGLIWFSIFTGLTIFSNTYASFAILRVLAGIGMGGVMPIAASLAAEYAPPQRRGFYVSSVYAGLIVGWVLSGLMAILVVPSFGWRIMFTIGLLPILYALLLAKWLPESLQILIKRGDSQKARQVLQQLGYAEYSNKIEHFKLDPIEDNNSLGKLSLLFKGNMGINTVLLWFTTFFTLLFMYGYASWLPTLMVKAGHGLVRSYSYGLVVSIAQVFGNLILGELADRFGAKKITIFYFVFLVISMVFFGMVTSDVYIYLLGILVGLFTAVQAGINTILAKIYPTNVRASGIGLNAGIGRLGSIFGPIVVGWIGSFSLNLEGYMISFAIMAIIAMLTLIPIRINDHSSKPREMNYLSKNESV